MTDSIPRFRTARTALLTLAAAGLLVAACDAPTPAEEPTTTGPEAAASREADGTAASAGGPQLTNPGEVLERLATGYGPDAREVGAEDSVTVRLHVSRDGRVSRGEIVRSSGHEALDRAALAAADEMEFEQPLDGATAGGDWTTYSFSFFRSPGAPHFGLRPSPELDPKGLHRNVGDGGRRELRLRADSIRLRGNASLEPGDGGSPLVIVDGVRVDREGVLADLRPSEITSIEVLKGPSAVEAYGEEARDGVVRITTKAAGSDG